MDIPQFKGESGNNASLHFLEFKDYLKIELDINVDQPEENDYEDIISYFKGSLKGDARLWYDIYFGKLGKEAYSPDHWQTIRDKFKEYFSLMGKTETEKYLAWENFHWDPSKEDVQKLMLRFYATAEAVGADEPTKKSKLVTILKSISPYAADQVCIASNTEQAFITLMRMMAIGGINITKSSSEQTTVDTIPPLGTTPQQIDMQKENQNKLGKVMENQKEITEGLMMITQEMKTMGFNSKRPKESPSYNRNQRKNRYNDRLPCEDKDRNDSYSKDKPLRKCSYCTRPNHEFQHCWDYKKDIKRWRKR